MKKKLLTAATAATLCAASGGAFADQPVNKEGPVNRWAGDPQQYITVCSNNGRGNNNEIVYEVTGLHCVKFVPVDDRDDLDPNEDTGESCIDTNDCDPKPE